MQSAKVQSIEVDENTAERLKAHAAGRGVSVSEVVAELLPLAVDHDALAELDRRFDSVQAGEATVPHARVETWLQTWGTADFKPWRER